MLKNLTFGQYRHKNSLMHNLDPRLKMIYVIILSMLIFSLKDNFEIILFSFFVLTIIFLSKLTIKDFINGLRPFFFIFVFILVMYLLFDRSQLNQGLVNLWRFLMLIGLSLILTFTTTISNLIAAIEKLSRPLKIFGIKPRNIATMISITIRFIPLMFINLEKIRESMVSRSANLKKSKNIKLIFVVLIDKMLKSASNLSDAMQSRLYNENAVSRKKLSLGKLDYLSVIFIMSLILLFTGIPLAK